MRSLSKLIGVLLCLNCSLVIGSALQNPCVPTYTLAKRAVHEKIDVAAKLYRDDISAKEIADFILKEAEDLEIDAQQHTVNGVPVRLLMDKSQLGHLNAGTYLVDWPTGRLAFIKVLDIKLQRDSLIEAASVLKRFEFGKKENPNIPVNHQYRSLLHAIASVRKEIRNSVWLESQDGPLFFGFGFAKVKTKDGEVRDHVYLESQWLFKGQAVATIKQILGLNSGRNRRPEPSLYFNAEVSEKIAQLVVRAMENGILPMDPDFMITQSGSVKWIDSGLWKRFDFDDPLVKAILPDFLASVTAIFDGTAFAKHFRNNLTLALQSSQMIHPRAKVAMLFHLKS